MYEAEIRIRYPTKALAKSVKNALSPDDKASSGKMSVSTDAKGRILLVHVNGCERIETLQSTIQDIFRCLHASESSLGSIAMRRGHERFK
jgi:tRNA threonylcarbamoyladenosine modification (KEOPS) complex  Pcc1 subunit